MKVKHTDYLPQDTLYLLDGIWLEMRSHFKNHKITKSLLIQLAIEQVAREVQEHGTDAGIYLKLWEIK